MTQGYDIPPPALTRGAALRATIDRIIFEQRDAGGGVDTIVLNFRDHIELCADVGVQQHLMATSRGPVYDGIRIMEGAAFDHSHVDVHDRRGQVRRIQL